MFQVFRFFLGDKEPDRSVAGWAENARVNGRVLDVELLAQAVAGVYLALCQLLRREHGTFLFQYVCSATIVHRNCLHTYRRCQAGCSGLVYLHSSHSGP